MMFKVHSYRGSGNIGDAIQTIALQRLLPAGAVSYAWRDAGHADDGVPLVVNGWLGNNAPHVENANCLFAGVFVDHNEDNYRWIRNSRFPEIGARDPATVMWCADRKIRASLIGCATLTFDRYEGARSGVYLVDVDGDMDAVNCGGVEVRDGVRITHDIVGDMVWEKQLALARELLEKYRCAELVVTSRLHVALPCLAFGTPVMVSDPMLWGDPRRVRRFSVLDAIGGRYGVPFTLDVTAWRERYVGFLRRNLGI